MTGVPPSGSGHSAEPEPISVVSAETASVPNAARFTPGPWALNRLDSAEEFARLKGETLAEHEGYYRTNSGAWIVTCSETDEEGYQVGGPVCEVTFKGAAKRGEAYKAPDPVGQANARLIAAAPDLYAVCEMITAASMGETRPSRGESFIGWQSGDGADAHTVRQAALAALAKARGEA